MQDYFYRALQPEVHYEPFFVDGVDDIVKVCVHCFTHVSQLVSLAALEIDGLQAVSKLYSCRKL